MKKFIPSRFLRARMNQEFAMLARGKRVYNIVHFWFSLSHIANFLNLIPRARGKFRKSGKETREKRLFIHLIIESSQVRQQRSALRAPPSSRAD